MSDSFTVAHPVLKKVQQGQIEWPIRRKQMIVDPEVSAYRFGPGQMFLQHPSI